MVLPIRDFLFLEVLRAIEPRNDFSDVYIRQQTRFVSFLWRAMGLRWLISLELAFGADYENTLTLLGYTVI